MTLYVNTEKKEIFQRWMGTKPEIDKLLEEKGYYPTIWGMGSKINTCHGFTYLYKGKVKELIKKLQKEEKV